LAGRIGEPTGSVFGACLHGEGGEQWFSGASESRRGDLRAAAIPSAPTALAAVVSNQTVTLTWSPPLGEAILSYIIEAGSAPGFANLASFSTSSNLTTFTAPTVPPGQYYVRVRAVNTSGPSGVSNEVLITVSSGACTLPEAPVLRLVANSGGSITLAWTVAVMNIRSYVLQAGAFPGVADLASFDLGTAAQQFSTSGVPPGTYYLRVIGRNSCGLGPASNELAVTVGSSGGSGATLQVDMDYCDCYEPPGTTHTIRIDGVDRATMSSCAEYWSFSISPGPHVVTACTGTISCRTPESFTVAPWEGTCIEFAVTFVERTVCAPIVPNCSDAHDARLPHNDDRSYRSSVK
jgi:hypothetical protein